MKTKPIPILALVTIMITIAQLSLALCLPSLPAMAKALQVSHGDAELTISVYFMAFGISQLFYGPLSDHFGRRPTVLIGLIVLCLGSLIPIFANNLNTVLIGRLVQGFGAGSISVLARAIIRDRYQGKELAKAMSYLIMSVSLTPALGAFIGGYLQLYFGWHGSFSAILIYTLVVGIIIWQLLPETNQNHHQRHQGIINVLNNYKHLLTHRHFLTFISCVVLGYSCQVLYYSSAPFIFEVGFKLSPAQYGSLIIIPSLGYLFGNFLNARLQSYLPTRTIMVAGMTIILISGFFLASQFLWHWASITTTVINIVFNILGVALVFSNATSFALQPFGHMAGTAAALAGFLQMLGSAVLSFVIGHYQLLSGLDLGISYITLSCLMLLLMLYATIHKSSKHAIIANNALTS